MGSVERVKFVLGAATVLACLALAIWIASRLEL